MENDMGIYLNPNELCQLTGAKLKRLQIEWLNKNGYVYIQNRAGEPVVAREHVLAKLGVVSQNRLSRRTEPNFPSPMKG